MNHLNESNEQQETPAAPRAGNGNGNGAEDYGADKIKVLEGLEARIVRRSRLTESDELIGRPAIAHAETVRPMLL